MSELPVSSFVYHLQAFTVVVYVKTIRRFVKSSNTNPAIQDLISRRAAFFILIAVPAAPQITSAPKILPYLRLGGRPISRDVACAYHAASSGGK